MTIIRGIGSGTFGKVSEKINVDSYYDIHDLLIVLGWGKDTGKLSVNEQRIIDSDYYQHFSYSLKSKIAYDAWNEIVSSMNHILVDSKSFLTYKLNRKLRIDQLLEYLQIQLICLLI